MLFSIDHAVGIARDLADDLSLRLVNNTGLNTVRQTQTTGAGGDPAGYPMLFISHNGNEAEGQPVIGIRIMNINVGAIDIFGNATLPFTPTQMEIAYELTSGGAPIPTIQDYTTVVFQATRPGTIIIQEAIPNGTAVTEASMNTALTSPVQTLTDIDWRNQGNT